MSASVKNVVCGFMSLYQLSSQFVAVLWAFKVIINHFNFVTNIEIPNNKGQSYTESSVQLKNKISEDDIFLLIVWFYMNGSKRTKQEVYTAVYSFTSSD